ncbi:MAG: protein kinase domain-containing protein [Planctomycetota bacterium]
MIQPIERLGEIFSRALQFSLERRQRFLDRVCRGDDALRARVERLLEIDAAAERGAAVHSNLADELSLVGNTLDAFKLTDVIGTGGMGSVFLAEQASPRRRVALKVMRRDLSSPAAVKRFEHEARVLARLSHPGIAQIFAAGVAEIGGAAKPYFAMEYVEGASDLVTFANASALSVRARVELFVQVCDAVQHGHQRGVIHRDLKPANILVGRDGVPKVIDFGVARSTDADIAMTTLHTAAGQLLGTLQYMSPEQCARDVEEIDLRADVYALGVVLYELLTGALPYDLGSAPIFKALQIVREVAPRPLSAVSPAIDRDLGTIVLKALAKDRNARYSSSEALGGDLRRYLAGLPIAARPPTVRYQLYLFARRHRALSGSLVALVAVLISAVIVAAVLLDRERVARADAEYERNLQILQGVERDLEASLVERAASKLREFDAPERAEFAAENAWYLKALRDRLDGSIAASDPKDFPSEPHGLAYHPEFDLFLVAGVDCIRAFRRDAEADESGKQRLRSVPFDYSALAITKVAMDACPWADIEVLPNGLVVVARESPVGAIFVCEIEQTGGGGPNSRFTLRERSRMALDHPTALCATSSTNESALLSVGSGEGSAILCHVIDGIISVAQVLESHARGGRVKSLSFLRRTEDILLVSASEDGTAQVWKLRGQDPAHRVARLRGHGYKLVGAEFLADGESIATASLDGTVRIWNLAICEADYIKHAEHSTGVTLTSIPTQQGGILAMKSLPRSPYLYCFGADSSVAVVDADPSAVAWEPGAKRHTVPSPSYEVVTRFIGAVGDGQGAFLAADPRGEWVATATSDHQLRLWPLPVANELKGHRSTVCASIPIRDGRYLLTVSGDHSIGLWDLRTRTPCDRAFLPAARTGPGRPALTVSRNERFLCVCFGSGVWVYPLEIVNGALKFGASESLVPPELEFEWIAVDISADQKRIAAAGREFVSEGSAGLPSGVLAVWNDDTPRTRVFFEEYAARAITSLRFTERVGSVLLCGSGSNVYGDHIANPLWSVEVSTRLVRDFIAPLSSVLVLEVCPERGFIAAGHASGFVSVFYLNETGGVGDRLAEFPPAAVGTAVESLAFHPTQPLLATGFDTSPAIQLWNLRTLRPCGALDGGQNFGAKYGLAFARVQSAHREIGLYAACQGPQGIGNVTKLFLPPIDKDTSIRIGRADIFRSRAENRAFGALESTESLASAIEHLVAIDDIEEKERELALKYVHWYGVDSEFWRAKAERYLDDYAATKDRLGDVARESLSRATKFAREARESGRSGRFAYIYEALSAACMYFNGSFEDAVRAAEQSDSGHDKAWSVQGYPDRTAIVVHAVLTISHVRVGREELAREARERLIQAIEKFRPNSDSYLGSLSEQAEQEFARKFASEPTQSKVAGED